MAEAADFGLMIWDGKSPGTILNVLRLLRGGKAAILVASADASRSFKSIHDWESFLASCRPQLVHAIKQRATPEEWHPNDLAVRALAARSQTG
jgi:adenine-specific DNA-methyltransferase